MSKRFLHGVWPFCFPSLVLFVLWFAFLSGCGVKPVASDSRPVSHEIWDRLLREHVSPEGWVDYPGFIRDSSRLNTYLDLLSRHHPNDRHWAPAERLAYWINAYNAFTVKLILDHYPLESIKDIKRGIPFVNTVWDIKFIEIEGQTYDLNNIEHGIIRQRFDDPRIHFAVNCASISCPRLRNEAFSADQLEAQLDDQARAFLADTRKNVIDTDRLSLSRIFQWYGGDFPAGNAFVDFLNRYAPLTIGPGPEIEYLDYDWRLNEWANVEKGQ